MPINGGVNVSILDGWWVGGYRGDNGWAIGDGQVDGDTQAQDGRAAEALYRVLETGRACPTLDRHHEELHRVGGGALQRSPHGARLRDRQTSPRPCGGNSSPTFET